MVIGLFFGIDKDYVYIGKISPLWYVGKSNSDADGYYCMGTKISVIIVAVDIVNTVRKGQYV